MSFSDIKDAFKSNAGLKTTFIVLLVATILTIYEISMFYFIITPTVAKQVDSGLDNVVDSIKQIIGNRTEYKINIDNVINDIKGELISRGYTQTQVDIAEPVIRSKLETSNLNLEEIKQTLLSIFATFERRESKLLNKINNYTKFSGLLLIFTLFMGLYSIKVILNSRGDGIDTCVYTITIVTMVLILIFQYLFYLYGQKYKYLGAKGNEELVYYLMNKI
jgi:hypothetical protein